MKKFNDIGRLLAKIQEIKGVNREEMSGWLEVDTKTLRKWLNGSKISDDSLYKISDITKIPYEVLVRLNHNIDTWYNIFTHRYSVCPFDKSFIDYKTVRERLYSTQERRRFVSVLEEKEELRSLDNFYPQYFNYDKIEQDVFELSCTVLPKLNIILKDLRGRYNGHLFCLPLKYSSYKMLKNMELQENKLTVDDIVCDLTKEQFVLHIYSLYVSHTTYAYNIIRRLVEYIVLKSDELKNTIISRYAITDDGYDFCGQFGMEVYDLDYANSSPTRPTSGTYVPRFFDARIADLDWIQNYRPSITSLRKGKKWDPL